MEITKMSREQLLELSTDSKIILEKEDLLHIFNVFGDFWSYDYEAAKNGKPGLHAELKSGKCSDGFFFSKIVLQHSNLRMIIASNMARAYSQVTKFTPSYVVGIPKGATELGNDVAKIMGAKTIQLVKNSKGEIKLEGSVEPNEDILLVEDFTTTGSGLKETVIEFKNRYPLVNIMPIELVILNRGDIEHIPVDEYGFFDILPLVEHRINSWELEKCPLCRAGSERIKPKVTDENWELLINSQK